ncbi:MAG: mandelate racemase/muconate lactonizing enzyme family protein [Clostridia bacterium]
MKISDVKVIQARHYLFVKVYTDEGIAGLGEAGNWSYLAGTKATIESFIPYLIGKDPMKIEDINQNLYRATHFRGSVIMSAISAIDIALWDIKGKKLGVPVYELLGGLTRNKIRVYASPMSKEHDVDTLIKSYKDLKKQGFTAAKVFVNGPIASECDGRDEFFANKIELEVEKIRKIREAVGYDFDLILEAHRAMSLAEAITFGKAVEKYRPYALEDPISPDNIDAMAQVARQVPVNISTGERFINLKEFQMLLSREGATYVRPDACAVGGITTAKKICALAEAYNVQVIPHNPLGPVSTATCLQIGACIPNLGIQELPEFCLDGAEDAMVLEPLKFKDGFMVIPTGNGIGIELADNIEELFPAQGRGSTIAKRLYDGSVKDW